MIATASAISGSAKHSRAEERNAFATEVPPEGDGVPSLLPAQPVALLASAQDLGELPGAVPRLPLARVQHRAEGVAEVSNPSVETALRELVEAVEPHLPKMNFYFGPGSRTAVSRESEQAWRRIKAAVERGKAALDGNA